MADIDNRTEGSDDPVAMLRAVRAVVHESVQPRAAFDQFLRKSAG